MVFKKINFFGLFSLLLLIILLNHNFSIGAEVETKNGQTKTSTHLGYIAPTSEKNAQQVTVNSSRGTCSQQSYELRLLSPSDHTPQTVSKHPTFLAYLPKQINKPFIFTVVEPKVIDSILEKRIESIEKSGFIKFEVPPTAPELEVNKEYILTIMIVCNEQRPSENSYLRISFKRVELNEQSLQELEKATSDLTRSEIYAQSGIWFDSIATIYEAYAKNPQDTENSAFFWSLLKQINFIIN